MQKIFEVLHNGKASSFTLTKIARSKLYGSKRRIPIDVQGQECSRAALTHDGMYILPVGSTALLYLDEHGDVAERSQLRVIDEDGEVMKQGESTSNATLEVGQVVSAAEVLDCTITHTYALEPVFISAELEVSLSQGIIYHLPEYHGRRAFLLGNAEGYFMLIGEPTGFEFTGLAEADLSPPDIDEDIDDDLDFCML